MQMIYQSLFIWIYGVFAYFYLHDASMVICSIIYANILETCLYILRHILFV